MGFTAPCLGGQLPTCLGGHLPTRRGPSMTLRGRTDAMSVFSVVVGILQSRNALCVADTGCQGRHRHRSNPVKRNAFVIFLKWLTCGHVLAPTWTQPGVRGCRRAGKPKKTYTFWGPNGSCRSKVHAQTRWPLEHHTRPAGWRGSSFAGRPGGTKRVHLRDSKSPNGYVPQECFLRVWLSPAAQCSLRARNGALRSTPN